MDDRIKLRSFKSQMPNIKSCLLTADCRLFSAFQKLLCLVEPALLHSILVSRRSLHGFNAGLHRTGRLLSIAQARIRATDQIQSFRVVVTAIEEFLQRVTRIAKLAGGEIGRADLAPDFVLRMEL